VEWQFGPNLTQAFREIKKAFDPQNLMNPGKIVDPPKMDEPSLFRFPPKYKTLPIKTVLDWRAWDVQNDPLTETTSAPGTGGDPAQGFGKAVEMCNNNGHCRKFDAGTMCPSYRVTRDEKDSTRGRANTLRMAVSGQLAGGFASDSVKAALDLCVSCKGCKRDCPTGVDMARMKIEFLHQYHRTHPRSCAQTLIAHLPKLAPLGRFAPTLINRVLESAYAKRRMRFAPNRSMPAFRKDTAWNATFEGSVSAQALLQAQQRGEPCAVLFVDTFNATYEVENVHAAVKLLRATGVTPHVLSHRGQHVCCGRTYLSVGMVEQAKKRVAALIEALYPFAQAGVAIVGLEPSCTLTLRDEALVMGLGDRAETIAQQTTLIETFLVRHLDALAGRFVPTAQPVLVHGHCHQKAFGEVSPTMELIGCVPNANPQLIDSSCCGMAGSFGYESGHYEISMKMAELSLLPAIRKQVGAHIVAGGTSCRHQIADGAKREAQHVVRFLADHLR
jgi:Fe-S oxidoreductase